MITVKDLKKKNIVFIVHKYSSFQKDYIEEVSKYFNQVYVFVRYKPIAEIHKFLPLSFLANHMKRASLDLRNKPSNILVIPIPIFYLPIDFFYKSVGPVFFKKIVKVIHQHKYKFDIIHSHFIWSSGYAGMMLKREFTVPLIITSHSPSQIYGLPTKSRYWKDQVRSILSSSNLIFAVNKKMVGYIKKWYPSSNTLYLPNGYNSTLFYPKNKNDARNNTGLPDKVKVILSIGSIDTVKGHQVLINAMSYVVKNNSNVICIIIGSGPNKSKLFNMIKERDLEKHVFLHERIDHNKIPDWINSSDIFVLPSLDESFGIVQIEAMACGKPVVASDTDGSKEIITSKDIGLMCRRGDSDDLGNKIVQALSKKWDSNKIINYSHKYKLSLIVKTAIDQYCNLF